MKLIMVGGWFTIFNFFEWLTLQISGDSSLGSYYLEVGISCPSGHENGVFRLIWGFTESPPKRGWSFTLASASRFFIRILWQLSYKSQWPLSSIAKTKESFTDFMAQTKDESSKDLLLLAAPSLVLCIAAAVVSFKQK